MKKYRLIASYPGCPEIGRVIEPKTKDGEPNAYYWGGTWFDPTKFPVFWEEVLGYEILKSCPIEGTIYSVKRLSDNQVFTLGDNSNYGEVKSFEVHKQGIKVHYFKIGDWQWLNSIEKTGEKIKKTLPKTYTEEDMLRAIEHWGFCQVDLVYINQFLNKK